MILALSISSKPIISHSWAQVIHQFEGTYATVLMPAQCELGSLYGFRLDIKFS